MTRHGKLSGTIDRRGTGSRSSGRGRSSAFGALALVLAMVLSACGSSDGSNSSSGSGSDTGSQTTSGAPFKIGAVCTCSGPQGAGQADVPTITTAWVDYMNANGGIDGHPVELTLLDDQGDAVKAADAARKLVNDEVQAIAGSLSVQISAWAPIISKAGIPVLGTVGQSPVEFTDPNFFPTGANALTVSYGIVEQAEVNDTKELSIFYCSEAPACAQISKSFTGLADILGGGVNVAATAQVSGNSPSYASQCLAAKSENANAMTVVSSPEVSIRIIQQCAQQGFKPLQITGGGTIGHNVAPQLGGSEVALVTSALGVEDTTTKAGRRLNEIIEQYAPDLPESPVYGQAVVTSYSGLELLRTVAEEASLTATSTSDDVKEALYGLEDDTLGGLTSPLAYESGEPTFISCYFTVTFDGQSEWNATPTPTCLSPETRDALMALAG